MDQFTDRFIKVQKDFYDLRAIEQKRIQNHIAEMGFIVSKNPRAGRGRKDYTSAGTLPKKYDLSNWLTITGKKAGKEVLVSLQPFDRDKNSKNFHVLMSRLGILVYRTYNAEEAFNKMVVTDIDLPMDDEKFRRLDAYIEDQMSKVK